MNVFSRAIIRIFSFGERLIVSFNSAIASLDGTINLSPHENVLTIALINIHHLYIQIYYTITYTIMLYHYFCDENIVNIFLFLDHCSSIKCTRNIFHDCPYSRMYQDVRLIKYISTTCILHAMSFVMLLHF